MMTLSKFYMDGMIAAQSGRIRYGQALFNLLTEVRPDLAEQVRGSDKDIFFMRGPQDNFDQWDRFATFIESQWHTDPRLTEATTLLASVCDFVSGGPIGDQERTQEFTKLKKKAVALTLKVQSNG